MDDPSGHVQRGELPVACTLDASAGPSRLERWKALHQVANPVTQLSLGELEVCYPPGPGVLAELHDLVAAERVCCAFVSWTVSQQEGHTVLRVTAKPGSPQDIEPIAVMFAAGR